MKEITPLFTTLYQESENIEPLTSEDVADMLEKMKQLDREGDEIILALIRNYQLKIENTPSETLPFDAKTIKNGYKFTVNKFPVRLQIILAQFVNLHHKKIIEEKQRNKFFQS